MNTEGEDSPLQAKETSEETNPANALVSALPALRTSRGSGENTFLLFKPPVALCHGSPSKWTQSLIVTVYKTACVNHCRPSPGCAGVGRQQRWDAQRGYPGEAFPHPWDTGAFSFPWVLSYGTVGLSVARPTNFFKTTYLSGLSHTTAQFLKRWPKNKRQRVGI